MQHSASETVGFAACSTPAVLALRRFAGRSLPRTPGKVSWMPAPAGLHAGAAWSLVAWRGRQSSSTPPPSEAAQRPERGRMRRGSSAVLLMTVCVSLMAPARSAAQGLTLRDAVAAAWERLPGRAAIEGRRQAAAARFGAAGAFLPNAPYASAGYVNDQVGSGQRYITYSGEVGTPVWLPGQGTASQNVAQADLASIAAEADAAHLALAAQVLDLSSQAALAANTRDVARRRLATTQALATDLNRRFRIGENAQSDALAADADASNARLALADAEAQLAAARAMLAAVTGSEAVPSLAVAAGAGPGSAPEAHPRLVAARKAVEAAQAAMRLTRIESRDSPTVGVQGIHEKQGAGQPYDTRFGLVVRFPFATEARNAPLLAAAQSGVTAATTQLALAERQVTAERRQAEALLLGARQGSEAAARAATALGTRRGQVERAWRMGEMPLIEVVRANALAFDAELARDKARTTLGTTQQRLRIAQGVLP